MSAHLAGGTTETAVGDVPVLMYHSIGTTTARKFRRFAVPPEEFAAQMAFLAAEGYQPVTAAELAASRSGRPLPPRPVVLTFDDAYTDFYTAALPVLRQHDFRAALYVPTAYVGDTTRFNGSSGEGSRPVLSWQALRDLAAEGVEVAAHSHTHPQMDRVPAEVVRDEAARSRSLLEDKLGLAVEGFAYPFGYWDSEARAAVARAGFRYAFAVAEMVATTDDDMMTLPRLTVNAGIGVAGLARLLARPASSGRKLAGAKQVVWRGVRRAVPFVGGDPREGRPAT
jgi:peptidoglycan/xylan/chitin deacetylase (PgdA/CDA1 family)